MLIFSFIDSYSQIEKENESKFNAKAYFSFDFFESNPFSLSICNCNYVQVEVAKCKVVGKDFN